MTLAGIEPQYPPRKSESRPKGVCRSRHHPGCDQRQIIALASVLEVAVHRDFASVCRLVDRGIARDRQRMAARRHAFRDGPAPLSKFPISPSRRTTTQWNVSAATVAGAAARLRRAPRNSLPPRSAPSYRTISHSPSGRPRARKQRSPKKAHPRVRWCRLRIAARRGTEPHLAGLAADQPCIPSMPSYLRRKSRAVQARPGQRPATLPRSTRPPK
jgi:hypothetical protein